MIAIDNSWVRVILALILAKVLYNIFAYLWLLNEFAISINGF